MYREEQKFDTYAVKKRLKAYQQKNRDIENQLERLDRLETRLYTVGSPSLSDMPKGTPSHDRMADMIIMKTDLEAEIQESIEALKEERKKIESWVSKLPQPDEKAVIRMRYIDGCSWDSVTTMLFGGKDDFLSKEDSYLRRTHTIHSSALINLAAIMQHI